MTMTLLLHLPKEVLQIVLSYLSYDNISKLREVCKLFNHVAQECLTRGFSKIQSEHTNCLKQIKEILPRRESERRKHTLYSKHDALQGLDTRLSLLKMTYNRYIMCGLCCFIPGKVLDELYSVLSTIKTTSFVTSVTVLLQEVRDVSSMAMEHFDEIIAPNLDNECRLSHFSLNSHKSTFFSSNDNSSHEIHTQTEVLQRLQKNQKKLLQKLKVVTFQLSLQKRRSLQYQKAIAKQNCKIRSLNTQVALQNKSLQEVCLQTVELNTQVQALQASLCSSWLSDSSQPHSVHTREQNTSSSESDTNQHTKGNRVDKHRINVCEHSPKRKRLS